MSGHHPFSELQMQLRSDPARAGRVEDYKRNIENALALADMRRSRGMTQKQLAEAMQVTQANVSRIEHGQDAQLSTIRKYVNALGGQLEIRAVFPDRSDVLSSQ